MPGDFAVNDVFDIFGDVGSVISDTLDKSQCRKNVQITGDLIRFRLHSLGQVLGWFHDASSSTDHPVRKHRATVPDHCSQRHGSRLATSRWRAKPSGLVGRNHDIRVCHQRLNSLGKVQGQIGDPLQISIDLDRCQDTPQVAGNRLMEC